jgi:hypothetical protein
MANQNFRVVVHHLDANGKGLLQEQFILSVPINADGRPDNPGIKTALTNNSKLRGSSVIVHSYANLDKEHANAVNILT